ncbi:hypothetical protein MOF21_08540 [Bacillus haynesii]|uniref:hypothetical protein n=1 Tax=Bacillus haynesii TaxID=1925021 RepID=UPI00227F54E2|nr:hypothetical protein [Bacillus haynesii]MCY9329983.1 hypothetical protein [Bacillus haynesii]
MNVMITMSDDEIKKILRDHFAQKGFNVIQERVYSTDHGTVHFDIQLYAYDILAKGDE